MDHSPRTIKTAPVQNGSRADNPASQSSPRRAGGKSTATTRGRDSAAPNIARETKPPTTAPPPAPLAAAVPSSAKINGAAQAGMLKANKIPRPAEPVSPDSRDRLGPSDTSKTRDLPVTYIIPKST